MDNELCPQLIKRKKEGLLKLGKPYSTFKDSKLLFETKAYLFNISVFPGMLCGYKSWEQPQTLKFLNLRCGHPKNNVTGQADGSEKAAVYYQLRSEHDKQHKDQRDT